MTVRESKKTKIIEIMFLIGKFYRRDSVVYQRTSKALNKLTNHELDNLLVMIKTSIN